MRLVFLIVVFSALFSLTINCGDLPIPAGDAGGCPIFKPNCVKEPDLKGEKTDGGRP